MKAVKVSCIAMVVLMISAGCTVVALPVDGHNEAGLGDGSTHTVFVEACTASWCGPCATAAKSMNTLYNRDQYDFQYVALVIDENPYVEERCTELDVSYIPDYHFDGSYLNYVGATTPEVYAQKIVTCSQREVADIEVNISAIIDEGCYEISLEVSNAGETAYDGFVRCSVVEKISRWDTNDGEPYHHAMVGDYAFKQVVSIQVNSSMVYTSRWDPAAYGVSDLETENVMIVAAVYAGEQGFVDECGSLDFGEAPMVPNDPVGADEAEMGLEYTASTSTTDPEEGEVYYMFDWGDGTYSEWVGPFVSGEEASASHVFTSTGTKYIRAKAKDRYELESEWSRTKAVSVISGAVLSLSGLSADTKGVHATLRNRGDRDAQEVAWALTVEGGMVFTDNEQSGSIGSFAPGDAVNIDSGMIFGFGSAIVSLSASTPSGKQVSVERDIGVFLMFVNLK